MIVGTSVLFSVSFLGIVALFMLKAWEVRRDGARVMETWRTQADGFALCCKRVLVRWDHFFSRLPLIVTALTRIGIARVAVSFSRLASTAAEHADRLADLVSYKHRFERRETKSDFLKRMSESTKGVATPLDSRTEK